MDDNLHLVAFCDGSCRGGNPGYGGFGIYGYTYAKTDKYKNHKHPKRPLYYTESGVLPERGKFPLEVKNIIEIAYSIDSNKSTNNEAELLAVSTTLSVASNINNLTSVTIYTDSNYVVAGYNGSIEKWHSGGWKKIDGNIISNVNVWGDIYTISRLLLSKNVEVNIVWIKGHSVSYGNVMADLYSVIGSNASMQGDTGDIHNSTLSYSDYKESFKTRDFIYHFKDMYFSSNTNLKDDSYCFISTAEDEKLLGKRNNSAIFINNIGYVPEVLTLLKKFYRDIPRQHVAMCCIKLGMLNDVEVMRLVETVNIKYLLVKNSSDGYNLIRCNTPFIFECGINYPFVIGAASMFDKLVNLDADLSTDSTDISDVFVYDITDKFIKEGKLVLTNKDKYIDLDDVVTNDYKLKQKLLIRVGYDFPNFLALKSIEPEILKVDLITQFSNNSNFCTVYVKIITTNREIISINMDNKYLKGNRNARAS